jgi:hypothetical protein
MLIIPSSWGSQLGAYYAPSVGWAFGEKKIIERENERDGQALFEKQSNLAQSLKPRWFLREFEERRIWWLGVFLHFFDERIKELSFKVFRALKMSLHTNKDYSYVNLQRRGSNKKIL